MASVVTIFTGPAEQRSGARTHLFVIATLCWREGSAAVRLRNMSGRGALIEGAILPNPGSAVVLKRGSLEISGRMAWAGSGQGGLSFNAMVRVTDWMLKRDNAHQDRIDEIIAALKSAEVPEESTTAPVNGLDGQAAIDDELLLLRAELIQLGNGLAEDVVLVATHPEIQFIDIALQRIDRIAGLRSEVRKQATL